MYWLKVLARGCKDRATARHLYVTGCAGAPGLEERRSQLVKTICDIHREDLDACHGRPARRPLRA